VDDLAELKQLYFQECEELLGEVERHLMALDEGTGDENTLHAAFRALHSIKGGAGAFGLQRLVDYAHVFEALLDKMRSNEIPVTPDRVKVLLRAGDVLTDLIRSMQSGTELPQDRETEMRTMLEALARGEAPGAVVVAPAAPITPAPAVAVAAAPAPTPAPAAAPPPEPMPANRRYRIAFAPRADMFKRANEPLLLIRELGGLGMIMVEADQSDLPGLDDIDPDAAYLRWTIELETPASIDAIREVFEFASDDCDLEIGDLSPPAADEMAPTPEAASAVADEPVESAVEPQSEATVAADDGAPPAESPAKPVGAEVAAVTPAKTAQLPAKEGAASSTPQVSSIRVDLDKLEKVVNLVGEIVISQAMLTEHLGGLPTDRFGSLIKGIEELSQHTRSLQDSVMAMRAQPVKSVFQRMPRLVREVASATGKKVRLVLNGEETEIDKTVIEQLYDPLVHMIRNSVDHGVETPAEREAAGKPAEGTVRLSAGHAGGRILIEISDDGKGINRERVFQKAVAKGLIPADLSLTESQIDDLIFLPGLSTAEQVSNISGRGVGMDVVRSNIQRMGGRVSIRSTPGQGSIFTLTLPLTLAVLDGMTVRVGDEIYVVPLANIIESLRPTSKDVRALAGGGEVLLIRGEYVPLIYVGRLFGVPCAASDASKSLVVLVEAGPGDKVGLVLDEIVGQQQVVIKSLEANYQALPGLSGATILGNGRVALILDVPGIHGIVRGTAAQTRATSSSMSQVQQVQA
jgi:two-component system, chemotaxis family, sensor kinase CheA